MSPDREERRPAEPDGALSTVAGAGVSPQDNATVQHPHQLVEDALHTIELALARGFIDGHHLAHRTLGVRPVVVSRSGRTHDPACWAIRGRTKTPALAWTVTCTRCWHVWRRRGWFS